MLKIISRTFFTTPSLVPKKLILVYLEDKSKIAAALSQRLQHELRAVHLNALETDRVIESPQVPFTVIITNRTLTDGILELKHYNPRIKEEVHVCDITHRLLQQTGAVRLRCDTKTARA